MVAVTGADGCVGRAVCARLAEGGFAVRALTRRDLAGAGGAPADVQSFEHWDRLLHGATVVIHLAARAHVLRETVADPSVEFERQNVGGALRAAEAGAAVGVRRFVFVSSIGVNGLATGELPFRDGDPPAPVEVYSQSKWRAECALRELSARLGFELTVVRPPLVYGPFVKGNMRRLVGLVDRGWPLPFGAIHNRRSFIGVDNLADFLVACSSHPRASGETLLIADGRDVSTPELIRAIAGGLGRDARLVPVPAGVLRSAGRLLGRASEVERLVGDLRVDSSRARGLLGWSPPVPFEAGILTMTRWYRRECGR